MYMYVITNNLNMQSTPWRNQNLGQFPVVWQCCNIPHPSILCWQVHPYVLQLGGGGMGL